MTIYEGVITDKLNVVIDIGAAYTKLGFSGECAPRCIIRSEVRCKKTDRIRKIHDYNDSNDLYDLLVEFIHMVYFNVFNSLGVEQIQNMDGLDMKIRFYEELYQRRQNLAENSKILTKEKYDNIIEEVKRSKAAQKKTPRIHWILKHYDLLTIKGDVKLISPVKGEIMLYYVHDDELFDILHDIHISTGHGGRDRMIKQSQLNYKNIVRSEITSYLSLCPSCQMKQKKKSKVDVNKSRCHINFMDYQSNADGEYKFALVYEEYETKFVILKPLETKCSEEVARHLLDIFTTIGFPEILQCDDEREFCEIIKHISIMWPEFKIVFGKHSHTIKESTIRDIEDLLKAWMQQNKSDKWSEGLRFVQFTKNNTVHSEINRTPYEAMFGCKVKLGLRETELPMNALESVTTEEELQSVIQSIAGGTSTKRQDFDETSVGNNDKQVKLEHGAPGNDTNFHQNILEANQVKLECDYGNDSIFAVKDEYMENESKEELHCQLD